MSHPFDARACPSTPACALCAEWNAAVKALEIGGALPKATTLSAEIDEYERRIALFDQLFKLCWRLNDEKAGDALLELPCAQAQLAIFDDLQERLCEMVDGGVPIDGAFLGCAQATIFHANERLVACAERALGGEPALALLLGVGARLAPERLPIAAASPLCSLPVDVIERALAAQATGGWNYRWETRGDFARAVAPKHAVVALDLIEPNLSDMEFGHLAARMIECCDAVCDAEVIEAIAGRLDRRPWLADERPAAAERLATVRAGRLLHQPLVRAQARFDTAFRTENASVACAVLLAPVSLPAQDDLYGVIVRAGEPLRALCDRIGMTIEQERCMGHRIGVRCFNTAPLRQFLKLLVMYAEGAESFPNGMDAVPTAWWEDVGALICRAPAALGVPPEVLRRACASFAEPASAQIIRRAMGARRARAYLDWRPTARADRPRTPLTPAGRVRHALALAGADQVDLARVDAALERWGGRSADLVAAYRAAVGVGGRWDAPPSQ